MIIPADVDVEGHRQLLEEVIERRGAADIGRTQQQRGFDLVRSAECIGKRFEFRFALGNTGEPWYSASLKGDSEVATVTLIPSILP
jgi:hypothetical protein